jgi:tetratricopeptide (TPR) repeat protein
MQSPTLCLNMIVKNESKIITRLFDSVINIIDTYVICDTGSTDNTIDVITNYFNERNISGKVVKEEFKNFCHNRNFALNSCIGMSDYILLMDADMQLKIGNFDKMKLWDNDCYYLLQGNDDFHYKNMRIVKNKMGPSYIGVTHEYLNIPDGYRTGEIKKNELFINDIGDGGCKQNKFERDVRLLTDGIKEEPNNVRYHFYLANTLFDLGRYDDAITYYKKRIEFGGWKEEVWYSYYKIGLAYKNKSDMGNAMLNWLDGYNYYPERLEGLYEIINYYRVIAKQKIGYEFYKMAKDILNKNYNYDGCLFHHNDIYKYKLAYEYTLLAAYVGINNINNEIVQILNNCNNNDINNNVIKNMKYYKFILTNKQVKIFDNILVKNINDKNVRFNSSSSCMINYDNGYMMNVRYVNYNIDNNGCYHDCADHIITINKCIKLDNNFNIINEELINNDFDGRRYIGIEDVRIYNDKNIIKFIGTGYHKNNTIGIVSGYYNNGSTDVNELKQTFKETVCEKNWVYIDDKIIYDWSPLRIGEVENNTLVIKEEKQMPNIFRHVRGSSCGYHYNNMIWFVVHMVAYDVPRHYYHMIVVFDNNINLLHYTPPFKFEGEPIEYCLSISIRDKDVYMNYSTWDRTTRIGVYDLDYIQSLLI